ncbi:MAG: dihydrofolate reductase [Methylomonas sp.]|nr:dihydrofolate reductase [Methylomonas sp.]PPD19486.1 MAG: dihydrofolate reductase [Methylomonas sp.]PPD25215.1 MAG: dihydrofolate reductase [Methylomonas sp.]PPD34877.1 MAG: dihydrofolate reductase [Methylomonas sp.]PPD38048.1 MAG: dihydrofolate reductase [Methylomonas sp.]
MKISLIAAMASNRVIGRDGQMPWHLSADLKHFKRTTLGAPVIMGRKTFDAIGHPLPGRTNIIISRNPEYRQPGCTVFHDIADALRFCAVSPEVFVIGGATLYQAFLPMADWVYLTEIHQVFAGDTWFPQLDVRDWYEVVREEVSTDPTVDFSYSFVKYARRDKINPT